jgi:predicted branched-subunit amino acid permease
MPSTVPEPWTQRRAAVARNALGVGVATGAYGISFGAVSVAAGLSVPATCALSVLLFSGGSQFALVGVLGAGGSAVAGVTTALLLGVRNALYGLRLAPLLAARGVRRLVAAQLTIDESTAMALGQDKPRAARLAFWSTGLSVFLLWNLATLVGAIGATAFGDPQALGLDAAIPAAFVALLWPRLRGRQPWLVAGAAAVVALALSPVVPAGVPVLVAALTALVAVKGDPSGLADSGPADSGPAKDGALP